MIFGAAAPLGLLAPSLRRAGARRILSLTHGHETWWARVPAARRLLRRMRTAVITSQRSLAIPIAALPAPSAQARAGSCCGYPAGGHRALPAARRSSQAQRRALHRGLLV